MDLMDQTLQAKVAQITDFLQSVLLGEVADSVGEWITEKLEIIKSDSKPRNLYLFFGTVPRKVTKRTMDISLADLQKAEQLRTGWTLTGWDTVITARIMGLLSYPFEDKSQFLQTTEQLFSTADVDELVALYHALPLLPYPEAFKLRAAEGIRTNMTVVFDAVALNNPYPHDFLDDNAWNQMVLKALFMERPIFQIWGVDGRSNLSLSQMISDFAHERWAAGRNTSPEMWRPIKSAVIPSIKDDLLRLLSSGDQWQQAAAVLAIEDLPSSWQEEIKSAQLDTITQIGTDEMDWDTLGKNWWKFKELSQN